MHEYREIKDLTLDELKTTKRRFWKKVNKGNKDECWPWFASKRHKGYGAFSFTPKTTGKMVHGRAHRFSYEIHIGPIGENFVLHKCDNPACVNPNHLFLGNNQDNVTDMMKKGRHVPGGTYSSIGYERGEKHHNARLATEDVVEIRRLHKKGFSFSLIAGRFKIGATYAWKIANRKAWKHVI